MINIIYYFINFKCKQNLNKTQIINNVLFLITINITLHSLGVQKYLSIYQVV